MRMSISTFRCFHSSSSTQRVHSSCPASFQFLPEAISTPSTATPRWLWSETGKNDHIRFTLGSDGFIQWMCHFTSCGVLWRRNHSPMIGLLVVIAAVAAPPPIVVLITKTNELLKLNKVNIQLSWTLKFFLRTREIFKQMLQKLVELVQMVQNTM